MVLDKNLRIGSGAHRRGRPLRSPAPAARPGREAGEKQGAIHTPPVIIRFFGQYLSFGRVGPSPCKVHAVPGKHRSSERDCAVSIRHRPRREEKHNPCFEAKTRPGKPNQCHQAKAQGSENLLTSLRGKTQKVKHLGLLQNCITPRIKNNQDCVYLL